MPGVPGSAVYTDIEVVMALSWPNYPVQHIRLSLTSFRGDSRAKRISGRDAPT